MKIKVTKLTPTDLAKSPEDFERLYDRRRAPKLVVTEPQPKLKAIENPSLEERMSEYGIDG